MGTVQALPRPDSYVLDWEAVNITGPGDLNTIKRLTRNTGWIVQLDLDKEAFVFTLPHPSGIEQWTAHPGDWVVKSPHGKFWFMGQDEFHSQFTWRA